MRGAWITVARLGLVIAVFIFVLPLAIFAYELSENPHIINATVSYVVDPVRRIVVINVTVSYDGSVPLTNFVLEVLNHSIDFGTLGPRTTKVRSLEIPLEELESLSIRSVKASFLVAGIYRMDVTITRKGV